MAFTYNEQRLWDLLTGYLPSELTSGETDPKEILHAFVKTHGAEWDKISNLFVNTRLRDATGIWLDLAALDRDTRRQSGESDNTLRNRLRTIDDALNISSLVRNNVLDVRTHGTAGATTYTYFVFFQALGSTDVQMVASGSLSNGNATLSPTNYNLLQWITLGAGTYTVYRTVGGATTGLIATLTNAKNLKDTGLTGDGSTIPAFYLPPRAEGVATQILRGGLVPMPAGYPELIELRQSQAFFNRKSYFDRGYRFGSLFGNVVIIILPHGTPDSVKASVEEAVRLKKAAGIRVIVEVTP